MSNEHSCATGAALVRQRMESALALQTSKWGMAALLAGSLALSAAANSAAMEPSVGGLWQKIDWETGKPVGWFLFVERNGSTKA